MAFSLVSSFEHCLVEVLIGNFVLSTMDGSIVLWRTGSQEITCTWPGQNYVFDTHVTLVLHEKCNLDRKV